MTRKDGGRGLFPAESGGPPDDVLQSRTTGNRTTGNRTTGNRTTGIVPYQGIRALIREGTIECARDMERSQVQPASLDLRLGRHAYRVRASFLPGPAATVRERIEQLDGLPPIDLSDGAVLEKGCVYVAEIEESVRLSSDLLGVANPKSSIGRLDVLTRLVADRATAFDRIETGYRGPLFVEIAPQTFSIVVRRGSRLTQVRFQRGKPAIPASEIQSCYESGHLLRVEGERLPLRDAMIPVTVDLRGAEADAPVGYRAKKNTNKIDVDTPDRYDPNDFWEKMPAEHGRIYLDRGDFYILGTREDVGVPPQFAAEMVPFDPASGEFRAHYAGFFDPGFGWMNGQACGSKAVLEVRSYGVSFSLEHAQIVGWLRYSRIAGGKPDKIYGADLDSSYQGQGIALSRHFKPFDR